MTKTNKLSPEWLSTVELAKMFGSCKGKTRRALGALYSEMPDEIKSIKHGKVYYWYLHNDKKSLETLRVRLQVNDKQGKWVPVKRLMNEFGYGRTAIMNTLFELKKRFPNMVQVKITNKNTNLFLRDDEESMNVFQNYIDRSEWLNTIALMAMFKHSQKIIKAALLAMQKDAPDKVKIKKTAKSTAMYLHKDLNSIGKFVEQLRINASVEGLSYLDMAKESGYSRETARKVFKALSEDNPKFVTVSTGRGGERIRLHDNEQSRREFYAYLKPKANMVSDIIKQKTR